MKKKTFYLEISQETSDYLQRLGMGVDARLEIINRLFTSHVKDPDDSVLTSVPFTKYHKEFEELNAEYQMAKETLGKELTPLVEEKVGQPGVTFDWLIEDFNSHKVKITVTGA